MLYKVLTMRKQIETAVEMWNVRHKKTEERRTPISMTTWHLAEAMTTILGFFDKRHHCVEWELL